MTTAASGYRSPPRDELTTTSGLSARSIVYETQLANLSSVRLESSKPKVSVRDVSLSALRTQKEVESSATVKRLQQDLLILTGFNDNSSPIGGRHGLKTDVSKDQCGPYIIPPT